MNKKIFSYMVAAAGMAAGLTSCSEEQTLPVGEGTIFISARVNSDVVVESRAEAEDELAESAKVWIYSSEGVVRKYNGISELPATGLKLLSGTYTVKAWAGKAEYASFESKWFEGETEVQVAANEAQAVEVVCKIANVVASVKYPENIDELISDYTMTISHKGGSLTFEGQDERKGYYMMPEGVTTLDYTLNFTAEDGAKTVHGIIDNVQPAHEYILNVIANTEEDNDGAAFIQIEAIEDPIEKVEEIVITTPPAITGYGFDLNSPVAGESGSIGRKSVYVCAASTITELELTGIPCISEDLADFNFINADPARVAALAEKGISHVVEDVANGQMIKIVFDDTYLNTLPNSDEPYVIHISAMDSGRKTAEANLTLRISEAPVVTGGVIESSISYTSAQVSATIAKEGIEKAGFEYAPAGTDDWQYIDGSASCAAFAKGQTYYATIGDLDVCSTYKYRAVTNYGTDKEYRGDEAEFSTINGPQLPNASFESWSNASDKALVPMPAGQDFWDSGNHGSITLSVNLTTQVNSLKHSGSTCAQLRSQFVGVFGIGAFAAGNIFTGKFIGTEDGTNGIVGFGQPFDFPNEIKPVAIKMWVKYSTTNQWKGSEGHKPASGYDEGHIFTALFDAADSDPYDSANDGKYGYVVHTSSAKRLFDKNATNIIAYGEKVFTESTPGSGLIELTIPYEYYAGKEGSQPKLIAVVCTASKYGDYFQGGEGTTMWLDDVEIVYGKK